MPSSAKSAPKASSDSDDIDFFASDDDTAPQEKPKMVKPAPKAAPVANAAAGSSKKQDKKADKKSEKKAKQQMPSRKSAGDTEDSDEVFERARMLIEQSPDPVLPPHACLFDV